jgi:nucleoid DNA-binding protein
LVTRQDIVEKISEELRIPTETVSKAINLFAVAIVTSCLRGEKVVLRRFGTFEMVVHKARQVKNHGKIFNVPKRGICKFRPGKLLRVSAEEVEKHRVK